MYFIYEYCNTIAVLFIGLPLGYIKKKKRTSTPDIMCIWYYSCLVTAWPVLFSYQAVLDYGYTGCPIRVETHILYIYWKDKTATMPPNRLLEENKIGLGRAAAAFMAFVAKPCMTLEHRKRVRLRQSRSHRREQEIATALIRKLLLGARILACFLLQNKARGRVLKVIII